jgi:hypothetical protein
MGVRLMLSCSADYMQGTRQSFHTKEQAIAFAERQGALHASSFLTSS